MGQLLKGKAVADSISAKVKNEVEELKRNNIAPKLKIVHIGEREDNLAYERAAVKRMNSLGISCEILPLPADIDSDTFAAEHEIKFVICPEKDIDCFNPINAAKLLEGDDNGFPPCTARAALEILKFYNIQIEGRETVVVGRSMVVGKPLSMMLLKENSTVTICHSKTKDLPEVTKRADILIAAIGKSCMITKEYIKENAVVIDVGINADNEDKITGDVDTDDCIGKAGFITPVPAGVGSVTTAVLADHVVKACKLINKK